MNACNPTPSHTCRARVMGDNNLASINCFRPSSLSPGIHSVPIACSAPSLYLFVSFNTNRASFVTASASVAACWSAGDPVARVARVVGTSSCNVVSSRSFTRMGKMVSSCSWGGWRCGVGEGEGWGSHDGTAYMRWVSRTKTITTPLTTTHT